MSRERWRAVARVEKTHGRRGEVVVAASHGCPALVRAGIRVALVPPELRGPRFLRVARCVGGGTTRRVSFDAVNDLGQASLLLGKTVLVRVADLPDGWELLDSDSVLGLSVIDERLGDLGQVVDVFDGGGGRIWQVLGSRGEVLVPAVSALVRGIDAGVAWVSLPVGLAPWDGGGHAD